MTAPRFSRYMVYLHIEKTIEELKGASPENALLIVPVLVKLQKDLELWNGARPFRERKRQFSMAIDDRARLDDSLLNFGFRRLPIADAKPIIR